VIGAGVLGSATAAFLLDDGVDVVCYEAVAPMSQRSAGSSRIFRLAHGRPELVALARDSLEIYREWSQRTGARLVSDDGTVVTGSQVYEWAAAMSAAGAEHRVTQGFDVPVLALSGPVLVDPAGGVLDAAGTGRYLQAKIRRAVVPQRVDRLEHHKDGSRVWSAGRHRDFDATVICAGADTATLAAQVGIKMSDALEHHVRFTFPLRDAAARPPCILEDSGTWRPGFPTYQHLAGPGQWAVGVHLPPEEVAWDRGRERVATRAREATVDYVRDALRGVDDRPLAELYCTVARNAGDGYTVERSGGFLTLHGNNLFKLAPVLGRMLAEAAQTGSMPSPRQL
jgi:sarcosine oxidase